MTTITDNSKAPTAKETVQCGDGCGTKANPGRRYRPGHDAKLASLLLSFANGQIKKGSLPKLVADKLDSKELLLPAATMKVTKATLRIEIGTVPTATKKQIEEEIRKVLKRKHIRLSKITIREGA